MIAQDISQWLAMGGYGLYVWGSLGVSLAALVLEVGLVRAGRRQALAAVCADMDAHENAQVGAAP
jgi:heme exporter protein D